MALDELAQALNSAGIDRGSRFIDNERRSQLPLAFADRDAAEPKGPPESKPPRRIGWASLLARVFAIDVTVCRKCGGRMRILEVVDTPDAVARVLHGARAPPRPPPPGQLLLLH